MSISEDRDRYRRLRDAGKLHGTIKRAVKLREQRRGNVPPNRPDLQQRFRASRTIVPLGDQHGGKFGTLAREKYKQRRNWESAEAAILDDLNDWYTREVNHGRYSSRCTWSRFSYYAVVNSWATVTPTRIRYHWLQDEIRTIKAPHGYAWRRDNNGLKLYRIARPGDDYHPCSNDLDRPDAARHCAAMLRENARLRRVLAKQTRENTKKEAKQTRDDTRTLRQAEAEGLAVCVRDSTRAGNCAAGTQSWARRHGLDPSRHYTPSRLLKISNGETHRVRLVVAVALRRHRREIEAGVCELSDHR